MLQFFQRLFYRLLDRLFPKKKNAPLSPEEESRCAMLAPQEEWARNKLIEHNLRLVVYIAKKFENTGVLTEDLISIGTIGLIKAVNTFNSEKKIKLATYASRCIENEILMHLRRTCKLKLVVSIDEPLNTDGDGNELLLSDVLHTALKRLNSREQEIVNRRYGLTGQRPQTQKQVADTMGISQSYISRLEKRILRRLQKEILRMQNG